MSPSTHSGSIGRLPLIQELAMEVNGVSERKFDLIKSLLDMIICEFPGYIAILLFYRLKINHVSSPIMCDI